MHIRSFLTRAAFVPTALMLAGCMNMHHGTNLSSLDQTPVVKGQTTEKELIARFGEPENTTTSGGGKKTVTWSDGTASVPFMGMGQVHTKTRNLSTTIENGIVVDFTESSGGN